MNDKHRPDDIKSFLIWGGWYGSRNIGDTAILLGLKELIHLVNGRRDIYIRALSTDVDYTCTNGVRGERAMLKSDLFRIWPWFHIHGVFRRPDKIIISGGTPIFDFSHAIRFFYLWLGALYRKPFVVFGAGVKPIKSRFGRWYLPRFLKRAQMITARDEDSKRILEGLDLGRVQLTADSAFFAKPAPEGDVHALLEKYEISPQDSVLIVAPRLLSADKKRLYLEEQMGLEVIQDTPKLMASIVDRVAGRFDKVLLIAMHFYGPDSDVPIIRDILERCQATNVNFLDQEVRPEIAIGIFRRANVLFGVRLHALLLAASMETPVVGVAYEQKVKSLFDRLEISDACHDLFDLDSDALVRSLVDAQDNETERSGQLAGRVSDLRKLVEESARTALTFES